ncbi:MAG TPA: hypothetical protein V6D17_02745 [Candidatus Obscuribacterales bacterium]
MEKLVRIIKQVALALLFGGPATTTFIAVSQVKAGQAQGLTAAEAAFANAPLFILAGKAALAAAFILLIAEAIDFAVVKKPTKLMLARYGASILCIVATIVFAVGIVPPMEELLPKIKTDEAAHAEFKKLHEISRAAFGLTILFALMSISLSALGDKTEAEQVKSLAQAKQALGSE